MNGDAGDARRGYQGCFGDGDGPYDLPRRGGGRTLPATLNINGLTLEQCAQAAGAQAYEVFALQHSGYCFMGQRADLEAMTRKLDNDTCSTTPCLNGVGCLPMVNKVYCFCKCPAFLAPSMFTRP
jgi:hypothetical protein